MFAGRTPDRFDLNPLTRALARRRAEGGAVADLTISNPTQVGIEFPEAEILGVLNDKRALTYEPEPPGWRGAREAVAAHHARQGFNANPDRILLAASTSELYGWLFKLLCEPGDTVLVPRPSYPLFECLAALECVAIRQYRLEEALEWSPDFDALEELAAAAGVRAIVHVNPNNPTGTYLKRHEWARLQALAERLGLAVIVDEVFYDYAWRPDAGRVSSLAEPHLALTFTLSGLSKAAGLPQMKMGWCHVSGPDALTAAALTRLEWIADSYLPVSAPVQLAAPHWLALAPRIRERIMSRIASNRGVLPFEMHCEGGWCTVLDLPRIRDEHEWTLFLLDQGFLVQPGHYYDFEREALAVVSLLTPPEMFKEAANALQSQ